jgi:hypothetical protein
MKPETLLEVMLPSSAVNALKEKIATLEEKIKVASISESALLYARWEAYQAHLTEASGATAWTLMHQVVNIIFIFLSMIMFIL